MYLLNVNFTGPDPVSFMEIEVMFGEATVIKETRDFSPGESVPITIMLEEGDEGDVVVKVRSLSGALVFDDPEVGTLEHEPDEVEADLITIVLIIIIVIVAGIIIYLAITWFVKPGKKEDTEDLEGIGAPSRYAPGRGPLGPERRRGPPEGVRGGRMPREELPPRGGMRRAPPAPDHIRPGGGGGRDVRRAPPAPDHLRPGGGRGKEREVRRAPPRRY
jgi:hypothetical protein